MRIEHTRAMALEMQKLYNGSIMTASMSYAVPELVPFLEMSEANNKEMRAHIERLSKENDIPEAAIYALGYLRLRENILRQTDPFAYSALTSIPKEVRDQLIVTDAKKFVPKEFLENPYLKNIKIPEVSCGGIFTKKVHFAEFEPFTFREPYQCGDCLTLLVTPVGYMDGRYDYMCLCDETGKPWMSITPNETETMAMPIRHAKGKVLTLGLGFGYFAYMAARKDDVQSVTVIEKDPKIIEFFKTYLLPQMEYRDKIEIIESDAFDFLDRLEDGTYDYCFADIWASNLDDDIYLKTKCVCNRFKKMAVEYWIENSFLGIAVLTLFSLFNEQKISWTGKEGVMGRYLERLFKDEILSRPEHLSYYLDEMTLKRLLGTIPYEEVMG